MHPGRTACTLLLISIAVCSSLAAQSTTDETPAAQFETLTLRGRVKWLSAVLARRYGLKEARAAAERVLVLESTAGELHPLIEDLRGRSFRLDERLRAMDVELLVRRHEGSPLVQVMRIVEVRDDGKFLIDYWCEICAIVMYELKECDCCQGPIELRKTRVRNEATE